MKEEYDFSNAEQGKFYVPVEDIKMPFDLACRQAKEEDEFLTEQETQDFIHRLTGATS